MPYRLIKTIDGRRGGFLFMAGLSYILIGIAHIVTTPSVSSDLAFSWIPYFSITANTLGWMWVAAGIVMLIGSALRSGVAYVLASILMYYIAGWPNGVRVKKKKEVS